MLDVCWVHRVLFGFHEAPFPALVMLRWQSLCSGLPLSFLQQCWHYIKDVLHFLLGLFGSQCCFQNSTYIKYMCSRFHFCLHVFGFKIKDFICSVLCIISSFKESDTFKQSCNSLKYTCMLTTPQVLPYTVCKCPCWETTTLLEL